MCVGDCRRQHEPHFEYDDRNGPAWYPNTDRLRLTRAAISAAQFAVSTVRQAKRQAAAIEILSSRAFSGKVKSGFRPKMRQCKNAGAVSVPVYVKPL
jgi:hypothetical protein